MEKTGCWVKGRDLKVRRKEKPLKDVWYCSVCGEEAYWDTDYGQQKFKYCIHCGARMEGVK